MEYEISSSCRIGFHMNNQCSSDDRDVKKCVNFLIQSLEFVFYAAKINIIRLGHDCSTAADAKRIS